MPKLPEPLGFVLSGGSSLGSVHVGMLHALAEAGIGPDLVVGTSVGAVNGAAVAFDPTRAAERLEAVWRSVRRSDVFPGNLFDQARTYLRHRTHLFSPSGLEHLIRSNVPADRFEELALPFAAVVTDARTGHPVHLRSGQLVPAVLASAAIPGIFPPVELDGQTYVDGGLASNVPMQQALDMGAAALVVLDPGFPCHRPDPPRGIPEMLLFAGAVLLRQHALCGLPDATRRVPVVYLPAPCPQSTSPFDFSRTAELIDASYHSTAEFLQHLEVDGPGLYGTPHVHVEGESLTEQRQGFDR